MNGIDFGPPNAKGAEMKESKTIPAAVRCGRADVQLARLADPLPL
jgi:hypothetical protein